MRQRKLTTLEDLGNIERAEFFADLHIAPATIREFLKNNWKKSTRAMLPALLLRPPEKSVDKRILLGDILHMHPHLDPFNSVSDTMLELAEAIDKYNVTGDWLKYLPGNHDDLRYWPIDALNLFIKRGILVPGGAVNFVSGGQKFIGLHGHTADPRWGNIKFSTGIYDLPFGNDVFTAPIVDEVEAWFPQGLTFEKNPKSEEKTPWFLNMFSFTSTILMRRFMRNEVAPYFPDTKLIVGHTHIPVLDGKGLTVVGAYEPALGYVDSVLLKGGQLEQHMLRFGDGFP